MPKDQLGCDRVWEEGRGVELKDELWRIPGLENVSVGESEGGRERMRQTKKGREIWDRGCMPLGEDCGGRLPEEPQVTGSCGYVDDVGADHFGDLGRSAAVILSVQHVSRDENAPLVR
jgi:hypothetical protein